MLPENAEIAINASGISKRYRIGTNEVANTFYEKIKQLIFSPIKNFRNIRRLSSFKDDDEKTIFWALKKIDFYIKKGEVLGFIGHNGAGKSTLLKVLSRITDPTEGEIKICGRTASLLEVGTGFHPELTGLDNVYLNGTILGMKKNEIDEKIDQIIEFSGVKTHINTPVKFYSSGMRVRLAFSVAAHLDPEILIIDEVLAVGDIDFQAKCIQRMSDLSNSGRTILFVSHDLAAVQKLCDRVCVLEKGEIVFEGSPSDAVNYYLELRENKLNSINLDEIESRKGGDKFRFTDIKLLNHKQDIVKTVVCGDKLIIKVYFKLKKNLHINNVNIAITVRTYDEKFMFTCSTLQKNIKIDVENASHVELHIDKLPITSGKYNITVFAQSNNEVLDWVKNIHPFTVINGDFFGSGKIKSHNNGFLIENQSWKIE